MKIGVNTLENNGQNGIGSSIADSSREWLFSLTASLCLMVTLIIALLGIKIWWFKHRLSFEHSNPKVSNGNAGPSQSSWRSKDKKTSQQVCESVVVHGVFRKRQEDELESIVEQPTQLPPIGVNSKFSQSTPNLLVPPTRNQRPGRSSQQTATQDTIDWSKWPPPTREAPKPPTQEVNTTAVTITTMGDVRNTDSVPLTPTPASTPIDTNPKMFEAIAITHTQPLSKSPVEGPSEILNSDYPNVNALMAPQPRQRLFKSASSNAVLENDGFPEPEYASATNINKSDNEVRVRFEEFEESGLEKRESAGHRKLVERRPTGILRPAADLVIEEMRNSATVIEINEPKHETVEEKGYIVEFSDDDSEPETASKSQPAQTKHWVDIEEVNLNSEINQATGLETYNTSLGIPPQHAPRELLGRHDYLNVYKTRILDDPTEANHRTVQFKLESDSFVQNEESTWFAASPTYSRRATEETLEDASTANVFDEVKPDAIDNLDPIYAKPMKKKRNSPTLQHTHDNLLQDEQNYKAEVELEPLSQEITVIPYVKTEQRHVREYDEDSLDTNYTWRHLELQLDKQSTESADEDFERMRRNSDDSHQYLEIDNDFATTTVQQKPKGFGVNIDDDWDSFEKLNGTEDEHDYDSLLWDDRHHKKRQQAVQHFKAVGGVNENNLLVDDFSPVSTKYVSNIEELYAELGDKTQAEESNSGQEQFGLLSASSSTTTQTTTVMKTVTTTSILKEHIRNHSLNSEQHIATRKLKPQQKVTFDVNTEEYYLPIDDSEEDDEDEEDFPSRSPSPPRQPPPILPVPMQRLGKIYEFGDHDYDEDDEEFDEVEAEFAARQQKALSEEQQQKAALLFSTQISSEDYNNGSDSSSNEPSDSWSAIRQHRDLTDELQKTSFLEPPQPSMRSFHLQEKPLPVTPPSSPVPPRPAYRNPLAQAAAAVLEETQQAATTFSNPPHRSKNAETTTKSVSSSFYSAKYPYDGREVSEA